MSDFQKHLQESVKDPEFAEVYGDLEAQYTLAREVIAAKIAGGEFAEQILADLVSRGLTGEELLQRFREINRAIRPAAERMIAEADDIAVGKKPYATMSVATFCNGSVPASGDGWRKVRR